MQCMVLQRPFCLSVCLSNACIVTKRRNLCPQSYASFPTRRIVGGMAGTTPCTWNSVRLVFSARRSNHTTPLLCKLHWLKVPEKVRFQLCVLTYRCLNSTAPQYVAETIRPVSCRETRQHLRTAETSTLLVPSTRCSTVSDWSFPVAAARAWNALPQHVRNAPSLSVFRRELKTVLFWSSFPYVIWQCTVLYLHARRSVLISHHVLAATNWFCWHCTVVLQQQCYNAT